MIGAFSIEDAKILNQMGTQTGGCWRCIQNEGPKGKTQWPLKELKFIGHRAFCPEHHRQEIQGSRDF